MESELKRVLMDCFHELIDYMDAFTPPEYELMLDMLEKRLDRLITESDI